MRSKQKGWINKQQNFVPTHVNITDTFQEEVVYFNSCEICMTHSVIGYTFEASFIQIL